jgi:alginate O-acetyltransferase complex protein AlgI
MLFSSFEFIFLFLPITFLIYFYLNKRRLTELSKGFLLASSLFFYSWWEITYLPLILGSMLFNFAIGNSLAQYGEHKLASKTQLLLIGITGNIGLLGYFKYTDFFIDNINYFFDSDTPLLHLALPLAISFFTFQQIAYLVDSYRGEVKEHNFLNYAVFVSFFPQLIAGPIVHHKEMMPQFANIRNKAINVNNIAIGLFIFSIGFFKKIVIADTFSIWATDGFDKAEVLSFTEAWGTSLSYTLQLYFDFSGYADMAIGAALLFNIKLPINFNSPYKATNIQDFWARWHITLTRFITAYIFTPIAISLKRKSIEYKLKPRQDFLLTLSVSTLIAFTISGLWHGAGWTFIFWGFLHGFAVVTHQLWKQLPVNLPAWVAVLITFNFVNTTFVFFRAKEWGDAIKVLSGMFALETISFDNPMMVTYILMGLIILFTLKNSTFYLRSKYEKKYFYATLYLFFFSVFQLFNNFLRHAKHSEFLYFNF